MKKFLNKRNIYITLFGILYVLCSICSLIHSFAFFGLANNLPMSIMLGVCFEVGQFAVLMSLLTSKKNEGKIMQYVLLITLTAIQILGNVFSSYKYLMINSIPDLIYFKTPIFIWTDLPDDITTVIVTWVIGAILPCVCLLLTSMVSNYIMDNDPDDNKSLIDNTIQNTTDTANKDDGQSESIEGTTNTDVQEDNRSEDLVDEVPELPEDNTEVQQGTDETNIEEVNKVEEVKPKQEIKSHFVNLN